MPPSLIDVAYRAQVARRGKPETLWEICDFKELIAKASREAA